MRRRFPLVFALIIIIVISTFVGAQQKLTGFNNGLQFLQYYSSALDRLIPALRPLETALSQFQTCIENQESIEESLLFSALIYQEKGDLISARKSYLEYLKLNPDDDWVYVLIADLDYQLGDYKLALRNYQKALSENEYAKAYYGIGRIYHDQGLVNDTIDAYKRAVDIAPEFVDARIALAKEYYHDQQFDVALEEFEMAYQYNIRSAEVHYHLWVLYTQKGDFEKANHSRDLAIQYDPSYVSLIETHQ